MVLVVVCYIVVDFGFGLIGWGWWCIVVNIDMLFGELGS